MRRCLFLDLKDDPALIAEYEAHHRAVWPEVLQHLSEAGIARMQIFRLGTRLAMVIDVDPERFDAERMARRQAEDPTLAAWEALMWRFQQATPWTPEGCKWVEARPIFDFDDGSNAP